jgi:hypothetical protein
MGAEIMRNEQHRHLPSSSADLSEAQESARWIVTSRAVVSSSASGQVFRDVASRHFAIRPRWRLPSGQLMWRISSAARGPECRPAVRSWMRSLSGHCIFAHSLVEPEHFANLLLDNMQRVQRLSSALKIPCRISLPRIFFFKAHVGFIQLEDIAPLGEEDSRRLDGSPAG